MFDTKRRLIVLSEDINETITKKIIESILCINYEDDNSTYVAQRKPIHIYLHSNGGTAYDAVAIASAILSSKTPIYTYALGRCMSACLLVYLAGHKRFASKYALFLYHQVSSYGSNRMQNTHDMIVACRNSLQTQEIIDSIIIDRTNINQHQLDEWKDKNLDWLINTEEALTLGVCHKIIDETIEIEEDCS